MNDPSVAIGEDETDRTLTSPEGCGYLRTMADTEGLILEVLKQIRDEVRTTNLRVDTLETALSQRIDATNERLQTINERLDRLDRRLATESTAVATAVRQLQDIFASHRNITKQVDEPERRIAQLDQHATH